MDNTGQRISEHFPFRNIEYVGDLGRTGQMTFLVLRPLNKSKFLNARNCKTFRLSAGYIAQLRAGRLIHVADVAAGARKLRETTDSLAVIEASQAR